jgi:hypothetical protein
MSTLPASVLRNLSLALGAILALAFLLTPSAGFAQTTTPTYLACTTSTSFGIRTCTNQYQILKGSAPNPNTYFSWPIGTINTTQVPETQAAYFACSTVTNFGITSCSGSYRIFLGSAPSGSYISTLIGYVYPTPVAGTEVAYLVCTLQTSFGISSCPSSGAYSIIRGSTPNSSVYQSWIIGYVTP